MFVLACRHFDDANPVLLVEVDDDPGIHFHIRAEKVILGNNCTVYGVEIIPEIWMYVLEFDAR